MKKRNRIVLSVLLMTILTISGILATVKAEPDAELVIISPHWEGITKEFETAFNNYYQTTYGESVDIEWLDVGGTSDVIKYVDSQFEANPSGIGIDIWWGGGVDPFIDQAKKGTLEPYMVDEAILSKIPEDFAGVPMYDSEYKWYGTALSGFGIVYNKALLQLEGLPTPTTWEDLTDPKVKGWVGSADPRHSGSTHMAYEIILQAHGWEDGVKLATMMGANVKTFPPSSSAIPKSVGAGDIAYGLAIDFYAWSEVSKVGADKIGYVMPEGATVVNPDSIAILKGAPNLEVAQRFLTFVLSEEGQKLWMLPTGEEGGPETFNLGRMSVIPDLFVELADVTLVPINPYTIKSTLDYNSTLGSLRYSLVNDLIGATIIDTHSELENVWDEIISVENSLAEAGLTSTKVEDAKDKMGEVSLTFEEANVAAGNWSDATLRNTYISEWHRFALSKYESASILAKLAATESEKAELESGFETEKDKLEQEKEALETGFESEREALKAEFESEKESIIAQYTEVTETLSQEKQNNLYMGLGGGVVVGIIVGFAVAYMMTRQREIEAIRS